MIGFLYIKISNTLLSLDASIFLHDLKPEFEKKNYLSIKQKKQYL